MESSKEPAWQSNRLFEETNWQMLQDERLCDVTFSVGSGKEENILAQRFILANELENRCLKFVMVNTENVLKSDGLSTISKEVFKKIIELDNLNADELCVYNACKKWAIAQCNGKSDKHEGSELEQRRELGDLIYSVRFATMSLQTFAENVAIEDILTAEEKVFVFQTIAGIASKKTSFPFPSIPRRQFKTEVVELKRFRADQYGNGWGYSFISNILFLNKIYK
ncbi:uncharacterized protein LOC132729575 [Ruditapes philippinarum]|uniref:uncharacterized protein LOC132729575 n=1 Tax=Ruditapes philippinarum TaxID=129788 RepID=UPI00295B94FA|nr:uncharacterized protein LOC132729575 [Ruditapes philippinarum]